MPIRLWPISVLATAVVFALHYFVFPSHFPLIIVPEIVLIALDICLIHVAYPGLFPILERFLEDPNRGWEWTRMRLISHFARRFRRRPRTRRNLRYARTKVLELATVCLDQRYALEDVSGIQTLELAPGDVRSVTSSYWCAALMPSDEIVGIGVNPGIPIPKLEILVGVIGATSLSPSPSRELVLLEYHPAEPLLFSTHPLLELVPEAPLSILQREIALLRVAELNLQQRNPE